MQNAEELSKSIEAHQSIAVKQTKHVTKSKENAEKSSLIC